MIKKIISKIKNNHLLLMILCCALPFIGYIFLAFTGLAGSWMYYLLFLLCPIGHIFIMRWMNTCSREYKKDTHIKPAQIEYKKTELELKNKVETSS